MTTNIYYNESQYCDEDQQKLTSREFNTIVSYYRSHWHPKLSDSEKIKVLDRNGNGLLAGIAIAPHENLDVRHLNLNGIDLSGSNLGNATMKDAQLKYANLQGTFLCGANLSGANMKFANMRGADLSFTLACDAKTATTRRTF